MIRSGSVLKEYRTSLEPTYHFTLEIVSITVVGGNKNNAMVLFLSWEKVLSNL